MPERVLLAPDAFKGTIAAATVARALAVGLRRGGVIADECPVADGGEGTVEVLLAALGGEPRSTVVGDPLGRPTRARWAMLDDGTAMLEAAQASGLALIAAGERDAERASSAGTGELIVAARDAGASLAVVAVGGTATTDGGTGALAAIEAAGGLGGLELHLACDVRTPFERAAELYAPQKDASPDAVARLARRLDELARELPRDPRGVAMTGAGGGLAGGLWSRHGARLRSGSALVLEAIGLDRRMAAADAVVIGEGRLDSQTLEGKVGGAVLELARRRGLPVHAVAGALAIDQDDPAWAGLASARVARSERELTRAGQEWPWPLRWRR